MAIPKDLNNLLKDSIIESTAVSGRPAQAVVNPDGTSIGSSGGGAATIADGADVTQGALADAAVAAGAAGSLSAKLRRLTTDLDAVKTSVASVDTNTGAIADAAVTAGATGSIAAKLRSISRDLIANLGISSLIPGVGATNLGKAEDAAHTTGDTGVMVLAVRESTPADLSAGNTNGDYEPLQVDANGALWTSLATALSQAIDSILTYPFGHTYTNIVSATTTTIKSGSGTLVGIIINKHVATGVITIYDNTAGSGNKIGTITEGAAILTDPPIGGFNGGIAFATGLTIVTSAAEDITVISR